MPERPLLILPRPGRPPERGKKQGRGSRFQKPGRRRQEERLAPQFRLLQEALEQRRTRLQTEAQGLVPEEVVVLETVGTVDGFIGAVEKIPGMEWLSEIEEEDIPPDDDFFAVDRKGEARPGKALRGRLFMVFANQEALRQMLALWDSWQAEKVLPTGLRAWRRLFEQLRDVRLWGLRDRLLETGVLEDWQDRVQHGQEVVPCEIELWYRHTPAQRRSARERVSDLVRSEEGRVVAESTIEEIGYHALLAHLPVGGVARLLEQPGEDMALVQCEQVQFFRASGQMSISLPEDAREQDAADLPEERLTGEPVIALFDGLPLQAHRRLEGRLIIDDPDGFEEDYPAAMRRHGTAMASLVIHGDLGSDQEPLGRPLYVRPILRPDLRSWRQDETAPEDVLVVDLLHRSVRRLFESDGGEAPAAPSVAVINLSIGIRDRPFDQALSPLARLLDWLAWRYQVLFVVSAGNHGRRIELSVPRVDYASLEPEALQGHVVRAVAADTRHRRLLSPAEAVNALTVAGLHRDASQAAAPPRWTDPYLVSGLPSPINAQGMGYRRAIKPDVLADGGRVVVQDYLGTSEQAVLELYDRTLAPGQLVAAPGRAPGERGAAWYTRGTSNATAMVSRAAGRLYEILEELRGEPGGAMIESVPPSVWLKALLAHGADWGAAGSALESILRNPENSRQFKEYVTRLLGYGAVNVERVEECTPHRATAISGGLLSKDESHLHSFPLPPSLSGRRGLRRLVITLCWLSPVNSRHQGWRRADLWFSPQEDPLRVGRQQAEWRAVQRGTLQHEIFEGEEAGVFVEGAGLEIQVSCRAAAGALEEEIPYALVTTLEVAEEIGVEIYDEVRVAIHAQQVVVSPTT